MDPQSTPNQEGGLLERIRQRRPLSPGRERQYLQFARYALVALLVFFCAARFINLTLDFPPGITTDGDPLTDEGLYGHNAINHYLTGEWYIEKDFNQIVNVPVLQVVQVVSFQLFGFGLGTARTIVAMFSLLYIAGAYVLARRWESHWVAFAAAALLAMSHFTFVFSRVSVAEVPMAALLTWALVFGAYARGRYAFVMAGLAAVTFTAALLTKTNAIFGAPVLAGIIIAQDLDWKRILYKFLLCSGIFFVLMGIYYFMVIRPNMEEFLYFYTLNVGLTSSYHPADMWEQFRGIVWQTREAEFFALFAFPLFAIPLFLLSKRYRTHPLLYIVLAWYILYILLFSTYGRFHNRFFPAIMAPVAIWLAITMKEVLIHRQRFWPGAYAFGAVIVLTVLWNSWNVGRYLTYTENSFNEAAREIRRIMDADPDSNNVLMGHTAGSFALRNGAIPRHDRYGHEPLEERLRLFRPSYAVSEMPIHNFPMEPYYEHAEWIREYARLEVVGEFDVLENFRYYPIVLYKLHPYEDAETPTEETPEPPPPAGEAEEPSEEDAGQEVESESEPELEPEPSPAAAPDAAAEQPEEDETAEAVINED